MGRRRRRVVRIVKKKLPTVFVCPRCGEEAVRVTIAKDTSKATVMCALCQLKDEFQAHPAAQMIDVYSFFADRFYGVKDPRAIIPHDREIKYMPPEETSEPEPLETAAETPSIPRTPEPSQTGEAALDQELGALDTPEQTQSESSAASTPEPAVENQETMADQSEKPPEEEEEPFADILGSKDKKRYSSTPVPEQQSEQSSQS